MTSLSIMRGAAALGLLSLAGLAAAAPVKTDPAKSGVIAVFKQMNVPVDAKFRQFNAQIDYDSGKPGASKASVTVDVASIDLGDPEYNQEVLKKEWFNAAQYPKASFVSRAIRPLADGRLDVIGQLTLKGKATDVHFPMTVKRTGASLAFDGALPIKRLSYNIGDGEWKDTSTVADEVVIRFHIVGAQ